jgi:DNA-directed RNA polymerase subunit K
MAEKQEFSKYERARILGARGLQISMDAPLLMKVSEEELDGVNYDPLRIAEKELDSGVLPISVNKPMPEKNEAEYSEDDEEELKLFEGDKLDDEPSDREKIAEEIKEEKEIEEGGEIMELAENVEEKEQDEATVADEDNPLTADADETED